MAAELPCSAGLLYHSCLEVEFLVHRRALGHVAVLADQFLDRPEAWPALKRLGSFLPILSHGVGLSLGSAEGLDPGYVGRLADFIEVVRPAWHGEHAAFTRAGGRDVGHFVPLPRTAESVRTLARNAKDAARELPCPLVLENVAAPFAWPGPVGPADFQRALAESSGCGLLLDLHNIHADAVNFGFSAEEELARWPLERVVELHAAGGVRRGGWLVDSHTRRPPEAVGRLLAVVRGAGCAAPVTLEWDAELPAFRELLAEVAALRVPAATAAERAGRVLELPAGGGLADVQRDFARAMLEPAGAAGTDLGLRPEDLLRARAGFARKRETSSRPSLRSTS